MQNEKRYLQKPASFYEYAMKQANVSGIFNQTTLQEDFFLQIFWCRYIHYNQTRLKPNSHLHSHSFFELHCVLNGSIQYNGEQQITKEISAGNFILIAPQTNHYLKSLTAEAETFAVTFEPICRDTVQGHQLQTRFDAITDVNAELPPDICPFIELIMQELHDGKFYNTQNIKLMLHILIINLIRSIFADDPQKEQKRALQDTRLIELKKHIGDNPSRVFTVAELAEHLNISSRQLNNIIHSDLGISTKAFIDAEKARQARDLLLGSTMNLQQISEFLGFSDHNNFNRFFKRIEGMSPGIFRLSRGK